MLGFAFLSNGVDATNKGYYPKIDDREEG